MAPQPQGPPLHRPPPSLPRPLVPPLRRNLGLDLRLRRGVNHLPPLLVLLLLALQQHGVRALVIAAPDACGGGRRRVATHASAFFGPAPADSGVLRAPIYAPYPPLPGAPAADTPGGGTPAAAAVAPAPAAARRRPLDVVAARGHSARFALAPAPARVSATTPTTATASDSTEPSDATSAASAAAVTVEHSTRRTSWTLSTALVRARRKFFLGASRAARGFGPLVATIVSSTSLFATRARDAHLEQSQRDIRDGDITAPSADAGSGSGSILTAARQSHQFSLSEGCDPVQASVHPRVRGRVALVSRGNCDFSEKVLHMQRAGAVGVVVVNYRREGERLANMKLNESKVVPEPIVIPAVMISFKDWAMFAPCRADGVNVSFTAEGEATFDIDYGRDALNWAMMRGMALWILCQCGVNVVRYKRRISELRARADAIAALPVEIYSRVTLGSSPGSKPPTELTPNSAVVGMRPSHVQLAPPSPARSPSRDVVRDQGLLLPSIDQDGLSGSDDEDCLSESEHRTLIAPAEVDSGGSTGNGPRAGAASASAVVAAVAAAAPAEEDEPVCAVCLDGFEEGQRVRRLDCTHLYHAVCLDPWLTQSSNCCPVCKREVPNLPPPPTMLHYGSMSV